MENLVEKIDAEDLSLIGQDAQKGFERDLETLSEWRSDIEEIREVAAQRTEDKTYPWPNASNVRYPIITLTALHFNARAYPTIINNGNIVLAKVIGEDDEGEKQERADRVSHHMSWQLTEEMDEWDAGMDSLLMALPIDGCAFKKVYYSKDLERNISEYIQCLDLVVNNNVESFATAPRISHIISLYPYEVKDRIDNGTFRDTDYGIDWDSNDQEPEEFVEQHCLLDFDEGWEPYIVTFHRETGEVARIVENFDEDGRRILYFVKYQCFPDPEGGFYGKGFGQLLKPISESADSILNLLIDAGHLSNTGGGFIAKGFRLESGALRFSPGEWKKVDVRGGSMKESIMPLPIKDPSPVLFQLLGLLIDSGKEIASVQEAMTGGGGQNMPATTVLAQIEQGMKVYTAIFKRIYRSLREELHLLYDLNKKYLKGEHYFRVMDDEKAISEADYEEESADISPAADPSMATDIQKSAKAQVLNQYLQLPEANRGKIMVENLKAAGFTDAEEYVNPPPTGPSPEQMEKMAELNLEKEKLELEKLKAVFKSADAVASAIKKMAEADELDPNNMLNIKELMMGMLELAVGKENYEQRQLQQVEGRQPVAPPGLPAPGGPGGPGGL